MSGSAGRRLRILRATVVSIVINLLLLGAAASLSHERSRLPDLGDPVAVNLVQLRRPAPSVTEPIPEPEPPRPKPRPDFTPDLVFAVPSPSVLPDVEVSVDPLVLNSWDLRGEFIFSIADLDRAPREISRIKPQYPPRAEMRRVEGHVQYRFLVDENGTISRISILQADPEGMFEDAALRAIARWKYAPGLIDGRPVATWVIGTVTFTLD